MSATIETAVRQAREIERDVQEFFDKVNDVLQSVPEYLQHLIEPIVAGMKRLSRKIAEFWAEIKPYLDVTGSPRKLERYAAVLINNVARPLNDIAGDVAIEKLETNTEWTGSGAEAYKAVVPTQGDSLEDLRDFVTELGNTLKELANGIENFWLAVSLALAALVVGIVAAVAEAGSVVLVFASIPTALGAVGLFLGALTTAVIELKSIYDTIDTSQDKISQGIVQLGTEWAKATPGNQVKIDTPQKWLPIGGRVPGIGVGNPGAGQRRPVAPVPPISQMPPIPQVPPTEPPRRPGTPPPPVVPPPTTGPTPPTGPDPVFPPIVPTPPPSGPDLPPVVPPPSGPDPVVPPPGGLDPDLPPVIPPPTGPIPPPDGPGLPPVVPPPGGPDPVIPPPGGLDPDLPPVFPPPTGPTPPDGPDFPLPPVTGPVPGQTSPSSSVPSIPFGPSAGIGSPGIGGNQPLGMSGPTGVSGIVAGGVGGLGSGSIAGAQPSNPANQRPAAATGTAPTGRQNQGVPAGFPLGGMGAGAGKKEEDQTRTSKWHVQGQLFDDTDPAVSFTGVVGTDPANNPKKR